MGMFDYVECKYPLPDNPPASIQSAQFQTKSFDWPWMETYVIEADGQLMYFGTEPTPKDEKPHPNAVPGSLESIEGSFRRVKEPERIAMTGAVRFYVSSETDEWFEYIALFIKGKLSHIERVPDAAAE